MDISYTDKIDWTEEKVAELKKCMIDPIYFAEKYFYINQLDTGLTPIKLYWYQKEMIRRMAENRYNTMSVARQNGKTTIICIVALWKALFHRETAVGILSVKEDMAKHVNQIIRKAFDLLPDFLSLPLENRNKDYIRFANGSCIITDVINCCAVRGRAIHYLFLDDFGYSKENVSEEFFQSVIPTISSSKRSQLCVISTPSSKKHKFFEIFDRAERGTSKWSAARYPWSVNPRHTDKWKGHMKSICSPETWQTEFELQFLDK